MSEEQLKTFLEKATGDASIQDKLKAAADIYWVVAIAKEAGFIISDNDLKKSQLDLSEEELEGATGVSSQCQFIFADFDSEMSE